MAAGSITISLLMLTGSFETDTKKAAKALQNLKQEAVDTGKLLGGALAAGAAVAAVALDRLIKGAADFKDLEEMTGASAEDLASMAIAAETAGVSMETLAANSIRLTKGLTGVDDESKAAGSAIKALGLDLAEFKKLDPAKQVDALTKAFAGFKDGSEKTAVATALWGKSGAEMLKVMKALEEQGGRTKILTQTQIDQADAYADAQAKAGAELKLYAQAAATQGAPAFLALTNAASDFIKELIGVDKETGKLAGSSNIKDFAEAAVKAIAFVVDVGDGAIRVFQGIGMSIGAVEAVLQALVRGELKQAGAIISELGSDLDKLASKSFFSDDLAARMRGGSPGATGPDGRPKLDFKGAVGKKTRDPSMSMEDVWKRQQDAEEDFQKESAEAWDIYNKMILKKSEDRAKAEQEQWKQVFDFYDEQQELEDEAARVAAGIGAKTKEASDAARELGMTFTSAFEDAIVNGAKLSDVLKGLEKDIIRIVTRKLVTEPLGNFITGAIGGMFGGLFGGAKAEGGPVDGGRAYLVGERGPEMFVPNGSGAIVPSGKTAQMMGGGMTVTQHFAISGPASRQTQEQLASAASMGLMRARARGTA